MAPHSTPCSNGMHTCLQGTCGLLHCSSKPAVTHRAPTTAPAMCSHQKSSTDPVSEERLLGCTWLMVRAPHLDLQKRGSEKGPLNLQAWVFRRNTQVGSRARNVRKTTETGKIPAGKTGVNNTSVDLKLQ